MQRLCCGLVAVLSLAGCATTGPAPNDYVTRNSSVVGMISLQGTQTGGDPCEGLSVVATSGGSQVGVATIRTSRERCSYQLDSLPADAEITLDIKPPEGWRCNADSELRFVPAPPPITLKTHQMRTQDFRAQCAKKSG